MQKFDPNAINTSKAENYHKFVDSKNYNKVKKRDFVKYLRRENPVQNAKIPSNFQSVEIVPKISDAGKADLLMKNSYGYIATFNIL